MEAQVADLRQVGGERFTVHYAQREVQFQKPSLMVQVFILDHRLT
jgi:hypothetical protein